MVFQSWLISYLKLLVAVTNVTTFCFTLNIANNKFAHLNNFLKLFKTICFVSILIFNAFSAYDLYSLYSNRAFFVKTAGLMYATTDLLKITFILVMNRFYLKIITKTVNRLQSLELYFKVKYNVYSAKNEDILLVTVVPIFGIFFMLLTHIQYFTLNGLFSGWANYLLFLNSIYNQILQDLIISRFNTILIITTILFRNINQLFLVCKTKKRFDLIRIHLELNNLVKDVNQCVSVILPLSFIHSFLSLIVRTIQIYCRFALESLDVQKIDVLQSIYYCFNACEIIWIIYICQKCVTEVS